MLVLLFFAGGGGGGMSFTTPGATGAGNSSLLDEAMVLQLLPQSENAWCQAVPKFIQTQYTHTLHIEQTSIVHAHWCAGPCHARPHVHACYWRISVRPDSGVNSYLNASSTRRELTETNNKTILMRTVHSSHLWQEHVNLCPRKQINSISPHTFTHDMRLPHNNRTWC